MKKLIKILVLLCLCGGLSGCIVTSVVGAAVGTAVDVVDAVTPDIMD
ncbi:hypothetical protein [Muribacter muris]|nr:hypothetical protein [Muribacter muris]